MADPGHVPIMDALDVLTVRLYRGGLLLGALGLLCLGTTEVVGKGGTPLATWLVAAGTALSVANLHLYDKRIRWFEGALGWTGLVVSLLATVLPSGFAWLVADAGLGFVFAAMSGIALKEQFCFRIPFLRVVPLILAGSLIPVVVGPVGVAGAMHLVGGALYALLAGAKVLQPLHYDIGDKSRYQV